MRSSIGARCLALSLAAAAVSLMLLGFAAGAEAAREAPVRVLVPSVGATLPAKPFWLRIKLGPGAHDLKLTLNGRSIPDSQILRGRHHICRRVQVSPNHGLRFGRNVLHVSARRGRGRPRTDTVRFRVRGSRPLAAAGLDLSAAAGNRLLLDGTESKADPGGSRGPGAMRYRWRIVARDGRPVGGSAGALEAGGARLVDPDSPEPDFVTAGPETDTIRLTVTAPDGRTGSDLLVVRSDPPPSVHVVVQAKRGGDVGVRLDGPGTVGDAFYQAKLSAWLQVVILRRDDLTLVSNTSIECPEAHDAQYTGNPAEVQRCADILTALLKPLDRSSIVIASSQVQDVGWHNDQPPIGVAAPLGPIGVAPWNWWAADTVYRGTFSAIGSPGAHAGAAQHVAASQRERTAQLEGTLVRAADGDYNFTPQEQYISTQAAGSDQNTNVVEIAGHRFVQKLGDHQDGGYHGGFQVVIADPESLQGTSFYFPVGTPYPVSQWRAMTQTLKAANDAGALPFRKPPLVVVASRGHPQYAVGSSADDGLNQALRLLADQVERAGGTRSAFMDTISPTASARTHRVSYTLIGRGGSGFGTGQESLGPAPVDDKLDELNTRPIVGTVAQTGQYSAYRLRTPIPTGAEDGASPPNGAMQLVHASGAAPTAWPEAGNAGREAAIRWLGEQVLGTDDPRSQYWTLPYASTTWDGIAAKIEEKGKAYVKTSDFDAQDLAWASDELQQEIRWLKTSYEYLKSLAEPFQSSVFSAWADMGKISADIKAKVNVASDAKSIASTELVFKLIRNLAAEIPVVGKGFAIMNEMYDAALEQAEIDRGEAPEDLFPVVAGEVGQELATRFEEAQAFLTKQMPRTIVSDYARLKLVGSCASPLKDDWEACPTDHAQWQFTQADQDQAARSLLRGSKLTSFGALLRAKYSLYELPEHHATTANKGFAGITYFTCRVPFVNEPATGQYAKPMLRDLWHPGAVDTNVIYALGSLGGVGIIGHPYEMTVPQASVTDELFGTAPGQLAAEPESFFDAFFKPQTLEHFNENDTPIGWKPECGA